MVYVRVASPADSEQIRSIVEQSWEIAFTDVAARKKIYGKIRQFYTKGGLVHEINHSNPTFLLAIDGDAAVAFASYKFDPGEKKTCELISLYCLPQTQGKGIDELLIKEVIKNIIAAGRQKIHVILNNYNGFISFFERMGFEPLKMNDPEFDSEILIMSKNIGNTKK